MIIFNTVMKYISFVIDFNLKLNNFKQSNEIKDFIDKLKSNL